MKPTPSALILKLTKRKAETETNELVNLLFTYSELPIQT
uniref:Uncharacterized protein n=1 Tax=Arundo donax TaxID=35708 RepID=A0A0A9HTD9_ARUDO